MLQSIKLYFGITVKIRKNRIFHRFFNVFSSFCVELSSCRVGGCRVGPPPELPCRWNHYIIISGSRSKNSTPNNFSACPVFCDDFSGCRVFSIDFSPCTAD